MPPEIEAETTAAHVPTEQEAAQNPRMLAMESITVKRDDDEPASTGADDQLALQTETQAPRVLTDGLDKTMVRVKVNGVEQELPVADVVKGFQIESAARQRMAEADELMRQARAAAAAAAAKPPGQVDTPAPEKDTSAHSSAESLGEFVDTLFEGDKDKAVAALAKLIGGRTETSPTLDLTELAAQVTPEIRQQLIDDSALERFAKDNADLAADPHLVSVTNGFIQEAVNGGKPYAEALGEGAQRTRDWLASIGAAKPKTEPEQGAHQPSKLERKAGIDEVQALNRTANTTQAAPTSPSSVIAEMRKARGQEA